MSRQVSQLPPDALDPFAFRRTCARFATGITIATVATPDGVPVGMTANSFTSVSAVPPLVLICVDHRSSILPYFRNSAWFGINVLASNQRELSVRFSQRELATFDDLDWHWAESGVPLLHHMLATLECSVTQVVEAGDHVIFIGEVFRAECAKGEPLLFYGSEYRKLSEVPVKPES